MTKKLKHVPEVAERFELKLLKVVEEAPDTYSYFFEIPENFHWPECAHTKVGLEGFLQEDCWVDKNFVRSLSIVTLPEDGHLGFTTRICSKEPSTFKSALFKLKPGDTMSFFKLKNRMTFRRDNRPVVLLSMGVGLATMLPLIRRFHNNPECIPQLLNINVDGSGKYIYEDDIKQLNHPEFSNIYVNSRKAFYDEVAEAMKLEDAFFYVVGSDEFMVQVVQTLKAGGVTIDRIVLDKKGEKLDKFLNA